MSVYFNGGGSVEMEDWCWRLCIQALSEESHSNGKQTALADGSLRQRKKTFILKEKLCNYTWNQSPVALFYCITVCSYIYWTNWFRRTVRFHTEDDRTLVHRRRGWTLLHCIHRGGEENLILYKENWKKENPKNWQVVMQKFCVVYFCIFLFFFKKSFFFSCVCVFHSNIFRSLKLCFPS